MRYSTLRKILLVLILLSLSFRLSPSQGNDGPAKLEAKRAMLISYVLRNNLTRFHFTKKTIDDTLSRAAFSLYLKQNDPQKRYLLKEDIELLKGYSDRIDDEMMSSSVYLPDIAAGLLSKRTEQAEGMIREILSKNPDFSSDETIETDPEKIDFCSTAEELKERWRKALKYQVLYRYLSMLEDEEKARTSGTEQVKTDEADKPDMADKGKKEPEDMLTAARIKILKNYETSFLRTHQENPRDRYDRYFGAFARAFDPHTDFMPPVDKEDFDIGMKGSLEGIGATLKEDEGYVKIVSIVPGGPAYRQGDLQPEDVILKVREGKNEPVDITDLKLRDAIKLIRGRKGTEVTLTIKKPSGLISNVTIVRDVVQLEEGFAKSTILKDDKTDKAFGYLKIPTFYRDFESSRFGGGGRNVTRDVKKELKNFESQNISGLILDLRNNGGGALTDAVKIAGLFIKTGPVVQVKGSDGKVSLMFDDDPEISYSGPVTVLVNKFSASASEILAGALQDYGRAVIIGGEHTHGKGTVQTIIDLNDEIPFPNMEHLKPLGALRMTTQKFYRITGESTQYRGITPDIILPDKFTGLKSGEQNLDYALPWDKIAPSAYAKWPVSIPSMSALKTRSGRRVASMQEFIDIDNYSKKVIEEQKKTVRSLNFEIAKKELDETRQMRDKEDKGLFPGHSRDKKAGNGRMTEAEKKELWHKEVQKDAYVKEGISVLTDILSEQSGLTLN